MGLKKSRRYIDRNDMTTHIPQFIKRQHGTKPVYFIPLFLAIIATLWYCVFHVYDEYKIIIYTSIPTIITMLFCIYSMRQVCDIIMATEFQNALFANAAKVDAEFCLIIKNDGTIIYSDSKFDDRFCNVLDNEHKNINVLLNTNYFTQEEKSKILNALDSFKTLSVPFIYEKNEDEHDNTEQALTLTVQPLRIIKEQFYNLEVSGLSRPHEFFFIKVSNNCFVNQLKESFDALNIGYMVLNHNAEIINANETFYEYLGYSQSELPVNIADILPENTAPFLDGLFMVKTKNNRHIQALIHYNQIVEESSNEYQQAVIYFLNTKVSVTIDNISNCWESIIVNAPIAIAISDGEGIITRANKELSNFLGSDDINNKDFSSFMTDESSKEINKLFIEMYNDTEKQNHFAIDVEFEDENKRSAALFINHIQDTGYDNEKYIIYLVNITEQKNLEQKFVHSQKMQAVGQLAGGVAHDFNNLLTAMIGFSDLLLQRHPAGDPSFAEIMQIKQNANRAANLVRQLLAFSRKQTLRPEVLDITDVISELANLIRRLIGEKIELEINHDRDIDLIKVDQGQLEQVIINLAVNARDAMKEGGSLTITTSNVTVDKKNPIKANLFSPESEDKISNGNYVLVKVKDSGCGINKKMLTQIFEPFFSTKELGSGTGLGLSTVYGIIKQTGGYIYVSSTEKKGTTFYIYLPQHDKNDDNEADEIISTENKGDVDLTGHGVILLVEDESSVRSFTIHALSTKGYEVLEADCGEAALEIVKERGDDIDLIITDVIMPGINGTVMVEKILKDYPNMKVMFISGYTDNEFIKTFGETTQLHFIPKPFTLKQLATKVKEVMSN